MLIDTLRNQLPGWTLAFAELDGVMGFTDQEHRTIWIDIRLTRRERGTTIVHEMIHAERGHSHDDPSIEREVELETARRLIPASTLIVALASSTHPEDLCDMLDSDMDVLVTRFQGLTVNELTAVRRQLVNAAPADPLSRRCAVGRWWFHHQLPGEPPCFDECTGARWQQTPPPLKVVTA